MFRMSPFSRFSHSTFTRSCPWPSDWAKVKYKYANRKPIYCFLFDGSCSVFCASIYGVLAKAVKWQKFDLENEGQELKEEISGNCVTRVEICDFIFAIFIQKFSYPLSFIYAEVTDIRTRTHALIHTTTHTNTHKLTHTRTARETSAGYTGVIRQSW